MKAVSPFASLRPFLQEFWLVWSFSRLVSGPTHLTGVLWLDFELWKEICQILNWEAKDLRASTKKLVRENIDWNYIGSLAWLGSQDPLFSQAGGVRTIHAISNLPHGHSSSQTFFGHFQRIDLVFFTVTKRTVGAFFLGTQGLSLASFGFRSPFQRWWNFISPNAYLFEGYT